jgi:transketolase N-terminal domain/subunit
MFISSLNISIFIQFKKRFLILIILTNENQNRGITRMIMQKEFIEKLKIFGLNSYESKIWVASIAPSLTVTQLINITFFVSYL